MVKIRNKEKNFNICIGLLITCFIVWIVSSFSFVNNPRDDIKDTAIYENQRPPKPGRYESTYLNAILRDCGQLYNTSQKGSPVPYFDHVTVPIDCKALIKNDYIDLGHGKLTAPRDFPSELMNGYTMSGRIQLIKTYYNNMYLGRTK